MAIKLFDIEGGKVKATEHCYTIETFKKIIEEYPKDYTNIFAYFHYMSSLDDRDNPFANVPEADKEAMILKEVGGKFTTEEELVYKGLELTKKMYETTTYYAYLSIKIALEKLGKYMRTMTVVDGRDGNIGDILRTAEKYDNICKSFEARFKAFKEENSTTSRGGQDISYDQQ